MKIASRATPEGLAGHGLSITALRFRSVRLKNYITMHEELSDTCSLR